MTPTRNRTIDSRAGRMAAGLCLFAGAGLCLPSRGRAAEGTEITAVYSEVSNGYARRKLPDGTFRPETFTLGEGGNSAGTSADKSIDKLSFQSVVQIIAGPLASQNFLSSRAFSTPNLLIMVYWGTTPGKGGASRSDAYNAVMASSTPPPPPPPLATTTIALEEATAMTPDAQTLRANAANTAALTHQRDTDLNGMFVGVQVENQLRDKADMQNALILGYYPELVSTTGLENTALGGHRRDLIEDLEYDRYFVVLMAYDYKAISRKQKKLLWVTRISIRAQGNDFTQRLPAMAKYAARYFGEDSHGLLREPLPEGRVEIGNIKSLGEEERK
jgi:hypothetical protein